MCDARALAVLTGREGRSEEAARDERGPDVAGHDRPILGYGDSVADRRQELSRKPPTRLRRSEERVRATEATEASQTVTS